MDTNGCPYSAASAHLNASFGTWGCEHRKDSSMNSRECPWFRAGCTMDAPLWYDCKWLCLHSPKPTLKLNRFDVQGILCSTTLFFCHILHQNIMNQALKVYEADSFCNRSEEVLTFQQPLNQWRSLTRDFVLIYLHLKCGRGGVVYLFQYWEEGIGETVVANGGDGLLKLMSSGWITGLVF